MRILIRVLVSAAALAVATAVVPGISLTVGSTAARVGTLIVVALIFGVVNAVLKPIVKAIGCLLYILTLGLIGLVVNGLLLWLTSWVASEAGLPFHVSGFARVKHPQKDKCDEISVHSHGRLSSIRSG